MRLLQLISSGDRSVSKNNYPTEIIVTREIEVLRAYLSSVSSISIVRGFSWEILGHTEPGKSALCWIPFKPVIPIGLDKKAS
jgi:hypothetical protein